MKVKYDRSNSLKEIWEEIKDKPIEYVLQRIADLEAKLAELEQENRELHTAINLSIPNQIAMKDEIERLHTCIDKRISELVDENDNLKQQLAEKEKLIMFADRTIKGLVLAKEIGKISFCIEQLEKVKEKFGYKYNSQLMVSSKGLCEYIDNQIASLKKGVE